MNNFFTIQVYKDTWCILFIMLSTRPETKRGKIWNGFLFFIVQTT